MTILCGVPHGQEHGLRKKHNRHGQHRERHEETHDPHPKHWAGVVLPHSHGNERVYDAGRVVHRRDPFVKDHIIHEAEEANHEHHHRNTFTTQIYQILLIDGIRKSQQQANGHLHDAEDDGYFHFQGVHENQLVIRPVPGWINSKRVRASPT